MEDAPLILVVEDNEVNRELLRDVMEDAGYRVNEAVNGKEAIEKALAEVPDLILMDIEMPVMNGLEAIKILMQKRETNRVPIIVLTGLNQMEDRIKAFDSGAMDYVNKPFDIHELLSHVRSYLRFSLLNKKYVLSTIAPETGLPNRASFREKIAECGDPKLFLLKIDDIEAISRFYGETTGTEIEKSFAGFLDQERPPQFKEHARLFHLGRGLFGFLVNDPEGIFDKEKNRTIARFILGRYENHQFMIKDVQHDTGLTIAVGCHKDSLLEKTEMVLDEALRKKTDLLIVDDIIDEVYSQIGENILWLRKIKEAVQQDRFIPFYQPILNNVTGKIEKYESLIRMKDEDGGFAPPGLFLPIASNSKYYHDITRAVLTKSMQTFKNRPEEFSVNLSALDIESPMMRDFIIQALEKEPTIAARLTFEVVEQEGFKHFDVLNQFIRQVKQHGVKIALDDFGSGYSNFRALMDMNVDYLKIDGSLIKNIHTDNASRSVVETIKVFAEKINLQIIAEFVENREILDCLKAMGIKYSQGYFIGKPEPI